MEGVDSVINTESVLASLLNVSEAPSKIKFCTVDLDSGLVLAFSTVGLGKSEGFAESTTDGMTGV